MIIKKVNSEDLDKALEKVNELFDNNIEMYYYNQGKRFNIFNVKIGIVESGKSGGRRGFQRRNDGKRKLVHAPCWHVFGHFFEELLKLNPEGVIISNNKKIYSVKDPNTETYHIVGNWEDWNAGSYYDPANMSDLCDCEPLHYRSITKPPTPRKSSPFIEGFLNAYG